MRKTILAICTLLFVVCAYAQRPGSILQKHDILAHGVEYFFHADTINDSTFLRMQRGGSFPKNCTVKRSDLRYLTVLHKNFEGETQVGELICNRLIANDLLDIFRSLYDSDYQICGIRLIDDYQADDEQSMRADNTSCFCYRPIKGSTKLSKHSQGLAIDINPLQNPCIKYRAGRFRSIQPDCSEARKYMSRTGKHVIRKGDSLHRLFLSHGFSWGGAWLHTKDYQHFER